jgi:hypothetical protein
MSDLTAEFYVFTGEQFFTFVVIKGTVDRGNRLPYGLIGWSVEQMESYCQIKGWKLKRIGANHEKNPCQKPDAS